MSKVEDFLTKAEEEKVVAAIRDAEKETSGEIRVHIENTNSKPCLERAEDVFYFLGMDNTKDKNGVLFYVDVENKQFAVVGDSGIDQVVPEHFWESVRDRVTGEFAKGNYADGLVLGIIEAGQKLQIFFPFHHTDTDELTNEISKG